MEIADNRNPKRPTGRMKPYWARMGLYVIVLMVSFLVSFLVIAFGCDVLLQAMIPAEPIVWRIVAVVLSALIGVGVTLYFAIRDGYAKRAASFRVDVLGGLLLIPLQLLVVLLLGGASYATGYLPASIAKLIFFANQPMFAETLEMVPPALTLLCTVAAVPLVYIPAMVWGTRLGVRVYEEEIAELKEENAHKK